MGKGVFFIIALFLISIPFVYAPLFGYDNPALPKLFNPNAFFGNFTWNGNCFDGGVEIRNDGTICGQRLDIFNITSLNITRQDLTITENLDILGGLVVDTTTLVVDSSNNRVGIGTNAPDSIFHIKANVAGTVGSHPAGQFIIQDPDDTVFGNAVITGYESDGAGNPDQQLWYLGSSSSSNSNIIFLNRRNSKLQLGTNDVSRLTILGDGNVGIGTTTPQNKLNVIGSINQTTGNLTGDFVYGSMVFHNDTTGNVTALTEDVWANFTGFDQDSNAQLLHGVSYSNSVLTIQMEGVYNIYYGASFQGTANNKYHAAVGVNGVENLFCETHDRIDNAADILSTAFPCQLDLNIGDAITFMYMNEDSGGDTTTLSIRINLVRIGN